MALEKETFQKIWGTLFNQTLDEKSLSDIQKILIDSLKSEKKISDIISSDIEPMYKITFHNLPGKENAKDN